MLINPTLSIIFFILFLFFIVYHIYKSANQKLIDNPINFGYKTSWLAIKTNQTEKVAEILKLENCRPCNWKYGIEYAYTNSIFIAPPVNGWTLVVTNFNLTTYKNYNEILNLVKLLSTKFDAVQYFANHRNIDYYIWIKANNGSLNRIGSINSTEGQSISLKGNPTEIEISHNLINNNIDSDDYWDEIMSLVDEEFIMEVAENWSINPTKIDSYTSFEKRLGIIGNI